MPTVVNLPPDIENRVLAEAARVGVTPDRLVADLLGRQLADDRRAEVAEAEVARIAEAAAARVAADRRAAAIALLDTWLAEADSVEQKETCEALGRVDRL